MDIVDNMNECVMRAFRPIVPHPLSLLGHQRDCWWGLETFASAGYCRSFGGWPEGHRWSRDVRDPSLCVMKCPWPSSSGLERFQFYGDLPVYTLYGLEEACLESRHLGSGCGVRTEKSYSEATRSLPCRSLVAESSWAQHNVCLVVVGCSSMCQLLSLPSARRPDGCISASRAFPGTPSVSSRLR